MVGKDIFKENKNCDKYSLDLQVRGAEKWKSTTWCLVYHFKPGMGFHMKILGEWHCKHRQWSKEKHEVKERREEDQITRSSK